MGTPKLELYNGLIEHAARAVVIFECFAPNRLSLEQVRVLEHLVPYGEDVGYKNSLQTRAEGRARAYVFRETMVRDAIAFLLAGGYIDVDDEGKYGSVDDRWGYGLSDHGDEVFNVCRHMCEKADHMGVNSYVSELEDSILARIGEPLGSMPDDPEFMLYEERLTKDVIRMEGLFVSVHQFIWNLDRKFSDHSCLDADWLKALASACEKEVSASKKRIAELQAMRSDRPPSAQGLTCSWP
jgi:hypothetical protein